MPVCFGSKGRREAAGRELLFDGFAATRVESQQGIDLIFGFGFRSRGEAACGRGRRAAEVGMGGNEL